MNISSIACIMLSISITCNNAEVPSTGTVHYLEDLKISLSQLIKYNQFVIVDVYAPWCGPCKNMHPVLNTIARNNQHILVIKADIEQFEYIRERYNIKSIPTLLFFKNGLKIIQKVGFIPSRIIQSLIDTIDID